MKQYDLLYSSRLAIVGTSLSPLIQNRMKEYSYDSKKMKAWLDLCDNFEQLSQRSEESHYKALSATKTMRDTRKHIHGNYSRHITLSRVAFRDNPEVRTLLGLEGQRKHALTAWLKQAQNFYYYASDYAETLEIFGIPRHELEENKIMLRQMMELLTLQKQAQSQEQVISQQKQEAYVVLKQWYAKFIKLARLAFEDEPQQLEALGIVVKSRI